MEVLFTDERKRGGRYLRVFIHGDVKVDEAEVDKVIFDGNYKSDEELYFEISKLFLKGLPYFIKDEIKLKLSIKK